jgi:predicted regulator of Ras-like GTPase activity (Roadblock/LC7/MglB family)
VSKQAELHDALRHLHAVIDGVHGTVLATRDGLPVASTLAGASTETVAAMAATVMALAGQAVPCEDDSTGFTVIRGTGGCLVVQGAGDAGVLAVQTGPQPNLGLVQMEAPAVAATLATALAATAC